MTRLAADGRRRKLRCEVEPAKLSAKVLPERLVFKANGGLQETGTELSSKAFVAPKQRPFSAPQSLAVSGAERG
jgi:hypothetical protein